MNFETFAMEHPWATTLVKSRLIIRFLYALRQERSVEEILSAFPMLSREDVERALRVLQKLGLVEQRAEKYVLTALGNAFLSAYEETFGA